jgi:glyoxylase-like metal-dependent hydrolase (beta-lactamase superfamily II)
MQSEMDRFPRLFRNAEEIPGLTWPTLVIGGGNPNTGEVPGKLTVDLGGVRVQIWSPGNGHTRGDTIAWVEEEKVLFSGDLVEYNAGVYTGDAHLQEWPATLQALRALKAEAIVPGPRRGDEGQCGRSTRRSTTPSAGSRRCTAAPARRRRRTWT